MKRVEAQNEVSGRTNRILNIAAGLMFVFPLVTFSISFLRGLVVPSLLWFSATQAYYAIRFVDMNVIAKPTRPIITVSSIVFLVASFLFSMAVIFPDLLGLAGGYFGVAVTFTFFSAFGFRSLMIHEERGKYLYDQHPRMFFETTESGYYNLGMAYFLSAFNAVGGLTKATQLQTGLMFGYYSILFDLMAVYFLAHGINSVKQRARLSKTKEGRKLKDKMDNDRWDKTIERESKIGSTLAHLLVPLSVISVYFGILGVYVWTETLELNYLTAGLLSLAWSGTMFSYNLRRSALTSKIFVRIARGLKSTVPDVKELRTQCDLVRNICGTAATLTFALGQFISNSGRDSSIAEISGVRILQSTVVYSNIFILLLLLVAAVWIRWYGLSSEHYDMLYRKKIASMLNSLLVIFYIITGGITGALAHAFSVPLLIDASLVAAWILTSFVLRYYLVYLGGSKENANQC